MSVALRRWRALQAWNGHGGRSAPNWPSGFTFVEIVMVVAFILVMTGIAIPFWFGAYGSRIYDTTALSDVANAAKAMEGMDENAQFAITVIGPGLVPGVPGARVSRGTTLFLRRTRVGNTYTAYVRGIHVSGSVTYYYQDGLMYTDTGPMQ